MKKVFLGCLIAVMASTANAKSCKELTANYFNDKLSMSVRDLDDLRLCVIRDLEIKIYGETKKRTVSLKPKLENA